MRGINKKGELSVMGMIGAALIIAILVGIIGYSLIRGAGDIDEFKDQLPPVLAGKATICKNSASSQTTYCTFSEIKLNNKDQYINCEYDKDPNFQEEIMKALSGDSPVSCNSATVSNKCLELVEIKDGETVEQVLTRAADIIVNGETCDNVLNELGQDILA